VKGRGRFLREERKSLKRSKTKYILIVTEIVQKGAGFPPEGRGGGRRDEEEGIQVFKKKKKKKKVFSV